MMKRINQFTLVVVVFAIIILEPITVLAIQSDSMIREPRPEIWQEDAQINDLFFVDEMTGWAVGDQGLILRTTDGGKSWVNREISNRSTVAIDEKRSLSDVLNGSAGLQSISEADSFDPIRCQFHCVHFVDHEHGMVAGSYRIPYMNRSCSVMMRTSDGGVTWDLVRGLVMPRINKIEFANQLEGWAVGLTGSLYKSGVFFTQNGGKTWSSFGSEKLHDWLTADKLNDRFVTVSNSGKLGTLQNGDYEQSVILSRTAGKIRDLKMIDPNHGWAIGNRGTILTTKDGGKSWSAIDTRSIPESSGFDFSTLCVQGEKLWIAGNPGTYVYSIDLKANQIRRHRTPSRFAIQKIHFVSDQVGWVAGNGGVVMKTSDGGATWNVQRGKDNRVAIMTVSPTPADLPLEILAQYCAEEGLLATSVCLSSDPDERVAQSVNRLGCSQSLSLDLDDESSDEEVVEKLARTIRSLQPNIIVVNQGRIGGPRQISQLTRKAIEAAADRHQYTQQLVGAGLSVWRIDRLFISSMNFQEAVVVDSQKLLPRMGSSIEDQIALSRANLGLPLGGERKQHYVYENFENNIDVKSNDLFSGLKYSGRKIPKRTTAARMGNLGSITRATTKAKQFGHLLQFRASNPNDLMSWRSQTQMLGLGLPPTMSGIWLFQLADQYIQAGQAELAAHTLEIMVNRTGGHLLTPAALVWLAQYYSSNEFHQMSYATYQSRKTVDKLKEEIDGIVRPSAPAVRSTPHQIGTGASKAVVWLPVVPNDDVELANAENQVQPTSELYQQIARQRLEIASRYLVRLSRIDPELAQSDEIKFIEAQIVRKTQGDAISENLFRSLVRNSNPQNPTLAGARREINLVQQPKLRCPRVNVRPKLDGYLDDPVWQEVMEQQSIQFQKMTPPGANVQSKTDLWMLAHDGEFLYVALRCHQIPGQLYQETKSPRPRDPDLSKRDRVEIRLDLDRDYRSTFELVMDCRGWVSEKIGGAKGWNPQWYVARGQDEKTWMIECAIPLKELSETPLDGEQVLAIAVDRLAYNSQSLWGKSLSADVAATGILQCLTSRASQMQLIKFD